MQKIVRELPDFYETFLPDFFQKLIPEESMTTCNDCAMCAKAGEPRIPGVNYYLPDTKCCTYFPKLPNYLVGGLLSDSNPAMDEGRRRMRERIQSGIGVTPHGVAPPRKLNLVLNHSKPAFGRARNLICPYYNKDAGNCTIWKFREAVCSTYFCKAIAGQEGVRFWNITKMYLIHLQDSLIWYCLNRLSLDTEVLWEYLNKVASDNLEPEDIDENRPPNEVYGALWGNWVGREEELYRACYSLVSVLSPAQFEAIIGINQKIYLSVLKGVHNNVISPKLPPVMKKNPDLKAFPLSDGKVGVMTQVGSFTIEAALYEVLNLFDGSRSTQEVAKLVEEKYDDTLSDELVVPMYQNRMLVPA